MRTAIAVPEVGGGGGVKSAGLANRCPDPKCHGYLTPQTNGNGGLKDVCDKCHRTPAAVQRALEAPAAPSLVEKLAGKKCSVEDCPGRLDRGGVCQCCVRRAKWEDENSPKRACEICGGDIRAARKRCKPCTKIFTKIGYLKKSPH